MINKKLRDLLATMPDDAEVLAWTLDYYNGEVVADYYKIRPVYSKDKGIVFITKKHDDIHNKKQEA